MPRVPVPQYQQGKNNNLPSELLRHKYMLLFTFLKNRDAEVSEDLSKSAPKPEKTREINDHVSFLSLALLSDFLTTKWKKDM